MKKIISLLLLVMCICGMSGCEKGSVSDVKIDYGNSSIYSEEDMSAAVETIKDEFSTWKGCELQSISYSSDDECNPENIAWLNELAKAEHLSEEFTQCIMFETDFHSPENGDGALNPDADYKDYQWWLARTDNGEWKLLSWGYC